MADEQRAARSLPVEDYCESAGTGASQVCKSGQPWITVFKGKAFEFGAL